MTLGWTLINHKFINAKGDLIIPKMSNLLNQADASTPLYQKKMRECTICKSAGFSEQFITFQNMGEDPITRKTIWKPVMKMVTNTSINSIH